MGGIALSLARGEPGSLRGEASAVPLVLVSGQWKTPVRLRAGVFIDPSTAICYNIPGSQAGWLGIARILGH